MKIKYANILQAKKIQEFFDKNLKKKDYKKDIFRGFYEYFYSYLPKNG